MQYFKKRKKLDKKLDRALEGVAVAQKKLRFVLKAIDDCETTNCNNNNIQDFFSFNIEALKNAEQYSKIVHTTLGLN